MNEQHNVKHQISAIAHRIFEMRDLCGMTAEEVAGKLGITVEKYQKYESGEVDIPIGVVYALANIFEVDSTILLTGEAARMVDYTVLRAGQGTEIERYHGYSFTSLAVNFIGREMDPMVVKLKKTDSPAEMLTHPGQEFNYVLSGKIRVFLGKHSFDLNVGDSIYFNPSIPHEQRALTDEASFLTVIND